MASHSRGELKSIASQLILVAFLVFAVASRVEYLSWSFRGFESGRPVPRMTYLPRFTQIAASQGTPYRDFAVEYPPVSLGAIELVAGSNGNETGTHLAWFMIVCDIVTIAALALGWGRTTAVVYLVVTVPLLGFLYTTVDLLAVALTVGAVALVVRGRDRPGGVAFAAAILAKVWPLAALPLMIVQRRRRALAWSVGALAIGTIAWVWWGGQSGPAQVATQRHTPGWEYESMVGSVLWAMGRGSVRVNDSVRLGVAPAWAKALLLGAAAVGVAAVWYRASRREPREIGLPVAAAVSILMLSAPLLSFPYAIWLAPWVAIAWTERRSNVRWLLAAVLLASGLLVAAQSSTLAEDALWSVKAILLLRNALLAAVPVAYLLETRTTRPEHPTDPSVRSHGETLVSVAITE